MGMQRCSKCIKPRSKKNKLTCTNKLLICTVWIHRRWSSSAFITCNSRRSSRMKNQIIIETFPSSWSSFGCWSAVQTKTGSIVSWVVKNRTPIYCLFDADLVLMIVDMIILKREKLKHFFIFVTYNTWKFPPPVTQWGEIYSAGSFHYPKDFLRNAN